jgi:hypothetical protein
MTPSMSIAIDNIYNFSTLLGLALIISVIFIGTSLPDKYGEIAFNNHLELQLLKGKDNPSKEDVIKIQALQDKDKMMARYFMILAKWSMIPFFLERFSHYRKA